MRDGGPRSLAELPALPSQRILVAEDNQTNRLVVSRMLQNMGHRVDVVVNGQEALAAVASVPYDLVLMDMMMPEMDGLTATKAIRALAQPASDVPIVALTANAFAQDLERCRSAGMDDVATKPITSERLALVLARVLLARTPAPDQPETRVPPAAAADPPPAAAPIWDRTAIDVLIRDLGPEEVRRLTDTFWPDTERALAVIADSATDRATMQREAHGFKASAQTFGLTDLATRAGTLEAHALHMDADRVTESVAAMRHSLRQARTLLDVDWSAGSTTA
jgi:CheY-like chemotaxis protein/HPt (histidine-containing phosphotransfer) domain-containing protein